MEAIIAAAAALLGQVAAGPAASGVVALLSTVAPSIATSGAVGAAVKLIASIVPAVPTAVTLAKNEIAVVKSVIASLRSNSATTKEQMDELDAFDASCDAIFDAALDRAEAADKAG